MSEEDIQSFEADYRGSPQEQTDLLQNYTQIKGNMDMVPHTISLMMPLLLLNQFCSLQAV